MADLPISHIGLFIFAYKSRHVTNITTSVYVVAAGQKMLKRSHK